MKKTTKLVHAGRKPFDFHGAVNVPVYRASTILHPDVAHMEAADKNYDGVRYGRFGTPTTFAFEEALSLIEGGHKAVAMSSGLAAITGALNAYLSVGDHVLVADNVYWPTRKYCDTILKKFGVEITYFDPLVGGEIRQLLRPNTRVVFTESPGSGTFEVLDLPAIAEEAHKIGAVVMIDNTWGILNFQPFEHGADISIQACTKYVVGHADAMLGSITTTAAQWDFVKESIATQGNNPGTEEVYLGLRGLRTLPVRLRQHQESAIKIATWLEARPEVDRVLYPALESDPSHALWKRDFKGACGLFGVVLKPSTRDAVIRMLDGYDHFALGYSWGGFESLVVPNWSFARSARPWVASGPALRYHVGLEDPDDLINDLEAGFARLRG